MRYESDKEARDSTPFLDVKQFHERFGLPTTPDKHEYCVKMGSDERAQNLPRLLPKELQEYREKFLQEELDEFRKAWEECDLLEAYDALLDLIWVALGTLHYMRLPFNVGWQQVRRANMTKVYVPPSERSEHKRGQVETIRKPADWVPPDHATALILHLFHEYLVSHPSSKLDELLTFAGREVKDEG